VLEIVISKFHTSVAEVSDVCHISYLISEQLQWFMSVIFLYFLSVKFVTRTNNNTQILLRFILQKIFDWSSSDCSL